MKKWLLALALVAGLLSPVHAADVNRLKTFSGTASQWPWQLNADGTFMLRQPSFSDLSGSLYGSVSIDSFGSNHDGVADDAPALGRAMSALGAPGGFVYLSCSYNYAILSNVTIAANVTIKHCRGAGWHGNPGIDWTTGPIANQPHVKLASSASFTLSSNSGYEGVVIRSGMTIPSADATGYAGTAFKFPTAGSNDIHLDALIVGFAKCLDGTGATFSNRLSGFIDCDANPGAAAGAVTIPPSYDNHLAGVYVRTYPFGTVAYPTSPVNTRAGYGTHILAGVQDGSIFRLFSYGNDYGIVTAANGNVSYPYVWTNNNTAYGLHIYTNNRSNFGKIYAYNGKGVRIENNSTINIGYYLCDSGIVATAGCLETAPGVTSLTNIGFLDVKKASLYAINIGSTSARVNINSGSFLNVNGGVGPYIVGTASWTADQVTLGPSVISDLGAGAPIKGGNPVMFTSIASASPLRLPANGSEFYVTGTTDFSNITGTWGGRRARLIFDGALNVTNSATLILQNGQSFTTAAGSILELVYDHSAGAWREVSRSPLKQVAQTASASDLTTGTLAIARGGTGTASPATVAGAGITVSGSFPNQTITNGLAGAHTTWSPTITGVGGTGMTTTVNYAKYKTVDKTTVLSFRFTITNTGSGNTGVQITNLPVTVTNDTPLFCRENVVLGVTGFAQVNGGATIANIQKYDNGNPVILNSSWNCAGTFENN